MDIQAGAEEVERTVGEFPIGVKNTSASADIKSITQNSDSLRRIDGVRGSAKVLRKDFQFSMKGQQAAIITIRTDPGGTGAVQVIDINVIHHPPVVNPEADTVRGFLGKQAQGEGEEGEEKW